MATVNFTAFLPEVLPHVIGCSDLVAVNAVRNSAIEFCERSNFWQEVQDTETVTPTDFPYTFSAPSGARVTQVLSVLVNGQPLPPMSVDTLSAVADWQSHTANQPFAYYQTSPYELNLYPALNTSATMTPRVAYAPTRTAMAIEEYVYQGYLEVIAAGALWRLMTTPGQPFSNPELGAFYRSKFQQGVTAAAIEANKTFGRAQLAVRSRSFA